MNPKVENRYDAHHTLGFTLSGVNVSLANGLRRTLLTDIPLIVFKTSPATENKCNIITNIPIHISNFN